MSNGAPRARNKRPFATDEIGVSEATVTRGAVAQGSRETVEAARAGSEAAWQELFDTQYPRLLRYFRSRVPSLETAEDLASETFADAYLSISRFRWRNRPFASWMFIETGASDPSVRVPGTLEAVERLMQGGHLPEHLGGKIQEAYGFMRRLIDALRVVRGNAKGSDDPAAGLARVRVPGAPALFESPAQLAEALDARMEFARWLWDEGGLLRAV